jgi:hypothetical protein
MKQIAALITFMLAALAVSRQGSNNPDNEGEDTVAEAWPLWLRRMVLRGMDQMCNPPSR